MPKVLEESPPVKPPAKGTAYWFKMPYDAEDSVPIRALISALRNPNAAMYAVRLWQHAARRGAVIDTPHIFGTIEGICRWTGKFGRLATALLDCGFLQGFAKGESTDRDAEGRFEIVPWGQLVAAEWQGANLEDMPDVTPEDRVAFKRAQARIRSQRRRDAEAAKRDTGVTDGVTPSVTERDDSVTERDDSVTERDENGPTRARETQTQTETQKEVQKQVPVPPVGSTPAQVALIPEPPAVEKASRVRKPKEPKAKPDDPQKRPDADAWVTAYKAGVPEADRVPLTQAFWVQWSARRKDVGIEAMLRSLRGILSMPRDKYPRDGDPVLWVTKGYANGITASSSAPIASTGTRGASASIPRPEAKPPPPRPKWNIIDAVATAHGLAMMTGRKGKPCLVIPHGESLPEGFDTSPFEVKYAPPPHPRLQDLIPAGDA